MNELNFKRKYIQIDLFGLSVELLSEDDTKYFFYLEVKNDALACYMKSRKPRKKKWSQPELLKDVFNRNAKFEFSDSNEFGFCLN